MSPYRRQLSHLRSGDPEQPCTAYREITVRNTSAGSLAGRPRNGDRSEGRKTTGLRAGPRRKTAELREQQGLAGSPDFRVHDVPNGTPCCRVALEQAVLITTSTCAAYCHWLEADRGVSHCYLVPRGFRIASSKTCGVSPRLPCTSRRATANSSRSEVGRGAVLLPPKGNGLHEASFHFHGLASPRIAQEQWFLQAAPQPSNECPDRSAARRKGRGSQNLRLPLDPGSGLVACSLGESTQCKGLVCRAAERAKTRGVQAWPYHGQ
jgi:hypothetical protein